MVIRTVKKEKENLPYRQQSVVGFFCIAEYHGRKFAGSILAEKRGDNNKKIAYQVEIYGIEKPRVISCADVKHSQGSGYNKALRELEEKAMQSRKLRQNWELFCEHRRNGREATFFGGFSKQWDQAKGSFAAGVGQQKLCSAANSARGQKMWLKASKPKEWDWDWESLAGMPILLIWYFLILSWQRHLGTLSISFSGL